MDRFASSRLRIVWACVSLLLAGLLLGAIQGFGPDGTQLVALGVPIPLGWDARPIAVDNLSRLIYTLVPAIILLGGVFPLGDWLTSPSSAEKFKGLLMGTLLAFLHGLFLSQVALLPIFAVILKLFGNPFGASVAATSPSPWSLFLQADLNALLLGLQLLLWASALGLLIRSNRGLSILVAYLLAGVGKVFAWVGEYGPVLEWPSSATRIAQAMSHMLPTEGLPTERMGAALPLWVGLPLRIGTPLALTALMVMLPRKTGRKK